MILASFWRNMKPPLLSGLQFGNRVDLSLVAHIWMRISLKVFEPVLASVSLSFSFQYHFGRIVAENVDIICALVRKLGFCGLWRVGSRGEMKFSCCRNSEHSHLQKMALETASMHRTELLTNLQNWTTLTGQPSRYGSTTNGKEIPENLLKLNSMYYLISWKEKSHRGIIDTRTVIRLQPRGWMKSMTNQLITYRLSTHYSLIWCHRGHRLVMSGYTNVVY